MSYRSKVMRFIRDLYWFVTDGIPGAFALARCLRIDDKPLGLWPALQIRWGVARWHPEDADGELPWK